MTAISQGCDLTQDAVRQLVKAGATIFERRTAISTVQEHGELFKQLYGAWIMVMRDNPEKPIENKEPIETTARCTMLSQSIKTTAALITVSNALAVFDPTLVEKALSQEQMLFIGQKYFCSPHELLDELQDLPIIPEMHAQFRAGEIPHAITHRLNWAKANLQMAGEVPDILAELQRLLPIQLKDTACMQVIKPCHFRGFAVPLPGIGTILVHPHPSIM